MLFQNSSPVFRRVVRNLRHTNFTMKVPLPRVRPSTRRRIAMTLHLRKRVPRTILLLSFRYPITMRERPRNEPGPHRLLSRNMGTITRRLRKRRKNLPRNSSDKNIVKLCISRRHTTRPYLNRNINSRVLRINVRLYQGNQQLCVIRHVPRFLTKTMRQCRLTKIINSKLTSRITIRRRSERPRRRRHPRPNERHTISDSLVKSGVKSFTITVDLIAPFLPARRHREVRHRHRLPDQPRRHLPARLRDMRHTDHTILIPCLPRTHRRHPLKTTVLSLSILPIATAMFFDNAT